MSTPLLVVGVVSLTYLALGRASAPRAFLFRGMTSFEAFRKCTGWVRPGRNHGCAPVEIVPGLWTAHYHDIDSMEKLKAATNGAPIQLVVNSALCQCDARDGFYGPDIKVMEIMLEDDPDPRKYFDQGKQCTSNCADPKVPLANRFPGEAIQDFEAVSKAVDATLAAGGHALIHCHASLSRSVAFILAHLMRSHGHSLLSAAELMKPKWDAVWPCDRLCARLECAYTRAASSAVAQRSRWCVRAWRVA